MERRHLAFQCSCSSADMLRHVHHIYARKCKVGLHIDVMHDLSSGLPISDSEHAHLMKRDKVLETFKALIFLNIISY